MSYVQTNFLIYVSKHSSLTQLRKEHDYMLIPAIGFQGNCDDAINFYKKVLGAEVKMVNYFCDDPQGSGMDESTPPNFVLYSEISIFGVTFMMTDGAKKPLESDSFWLQLSFNTPEEVTSVFNKLAEGGTIVEALSSELYGYLMGSVTDRFGVPWNISIYFD